MRPWMLVPAWYAAVAVAGVVVMARRRRRKRLEAEQAAIEIAYLYHLYAMESAEEPS